MGAFLIALGLVAQANMFIEHREELGKPVPAPFVKTCEYAVDCLAN